MPEWEYKDPFSFSADPTARGDQVVKYVREWYEENRESWWDRHRPSADRHGLHADEFMLRLVAYVQYVSNKADIAQKKYEELQAKIPEYSHTPGRDFKGKLPAVKPKKKALKTKRKVKIKYDKDDDGIE